MNNKVLTEPKMKICVLTSAYPLDAADPQVPWVRSAVKSMATRNDVTVVAPAFAGSPSHTIDEVRVLRFRYAPSFWENTLDEHCVDRGVGYTLSKWLALPYLVCGTLALCFWILRHRFDVINVQGVYPCGMLTLLPNLLGVKVIANCDEHDLLRASKSGLANALFRWFLIRADECRCPSSASAAQVRRISGREAHVIPYAAISDGSADRTPPPTKAPQEISEVLFCDNGADRADLALLIRALPIVLAERKVRLVIVGERHRTIGSRALTFALGVQASIRFVDSLESNEEGELCRTCDLYVHASAAREQHRETTPQVSLMAAMFNERPILTFEEGCGDLIHHNVTGYVLERKSEAALGSAILQLLADPNRTRKLGAEARKFAEHYFDWSHITDQNEELIRTTLHLPKIEALKAARGLRKRPDSSQLPIFTNPAAVL